MAGHRTQAAALAHDGGQDGEVALIDIVAFARQCHRELVDEHSQGSLETQDRLHLNDVVAVAADGVHAGLHHAFPENLPAATHDNKLAATSAVLVLGGVDAHDTADSHRQQLVAKDIQRGTLRGLVAPRMDPPLRCPDRTPHDTDALGARTADALAHTRHVVPQLVDHLGFVQQEAHAPGRRRRLLAAEQQRFHRRLVLRELLGARELAQYAVGQSHVDEAACQCLGSHLRRGQRRSKEYRGHRRRDGAAAVEDLLDTAHSQGEVCLGLHPGRVESV